MNMRTLVLLALGVAFYAVSRSLEAQGDAAPFAAHGASAERLKYHLPALILLVAAFGSFIAAGFSAFWKKRD